MRFYDLDCNSELRRGELFYLVYNLEKLQYYLGEQDIEKISKMIETILKQIRCIYNFLNITEEEEKKYINSELKQSDGLLMVPELLLETIKREVNNENNLDRLYYYLVNVKRDFIDLYNLLVQDTSKKISQ